MIRKVTSVVAHVVHGVVTGSYRYTTLMDVTALAVFLGMRARGSLFGGVVRSTVILGVWIFVFFVPLMFIGSLIGVAADNYDASADAAEAPSMTRGY